MRSGFFNSNITGYDEQGQPIFDRAEDATFFARYFSQIVGNGVFAQPGIGLMVQAKEGMTVTVQAGTCFINGYMGWLENDQPLSIAAASTVYDRIDRIVVRYDALQRNIDVYLVQGQASAAPVAPELVRDGDKYELALADVYVARNATALRQADITDLRLNESVCGIVASPIEHLETGQVTAQLTDAFDQWFEKMKGQLTEDAAGHLQEQVDAVSEQTQTHAASQSMHVSEADRSQWNAYGNLPGSMQIWPGAQAPEGWLLCQGQAVSRTGYEKLFSVIGTMYGAGDGSNTFNVPDMRGRVPIGADTTYTLAQKGGATEYEHNHEAGGLAAAIGAYNDDIATIGYSATYPISGNWFSFGASIGLKRLDTSAKVNHNTRVLGFTADSAIEVMQPYLALNYIIKY